MDKDIRYNHKLYYSSINSYILTLKKLMNDEVRNKIKQNLDVYFPIIYLIEYIIEYYQSDKFWQIGRSRIIVERDNYGDMLSIGYLKNIPPDIIVRNKNQVNQNNNIENECNNDDHDIVFRTSDFTKQEIKFLTQNEFIDE